MIVKNFFITKIDMSTKKRVWFKSLYTVIDENQMFTLKAFSDFEDAKKHHNDIILYHDTDNKNTFPKQINVNMLNKTVSKELIPNIPMEYPKYKYIGHELFPDGTIIPFEYSHDKDEIYTIKKGQEN